MRTLALGGRVVPDPTLFVFDGYNLLHAAGMESRDELVNRLAELVALRGARGVVVFDGVGEERRVGALDVRFAPHADELIERLAAEHRGAEEVAVVSSDATVRDTAGVGVQRISARNFLRELAREPRSEHAGPSSRSKVEDRLDADTRARLERWRRER
jgi:predicted RNA-binding protein with PIN domain